ncbi:hypothetical protein CAUPRSCDRAFT_11940 [Caulochytrium protostelioides]|uniref:Pentacotripeptide-repeat region of PRORP domain-containing protein n=1 Tax=Caulochytrium protostelioides TaxID=1555241 RepID=A0A4P9WT09_9FUNG|nr:hypothetical protein CAUPRSCDRAFT_11940 [Caulochytrium protostelioides]
MAFLDLLSLRWPNELPGWYSSQCEAKTPLYSDDAVPDFRTPRSPRPTTVSYPTHSPSFIVMLVKNTIERPRSLIYKVRNLYEYAAQYVHEPNLWMDRAQLIALIQESKLAEARAFWNTVVVPRWGHTPGDRFDQFWGTLTINLMGAMEHKIITSARSEADPEDVAWVCEIFNLIHTRLGAVPSTELWALYNFLHRTRLKGSCAKIGWHLAHVWIPSPPTAEIHQLLRLWLAGEEKDLKKVEAMFSQVASDGGVLSDALILGFVHAYAECGQPDRGAMYLRAIQDQHRPFPLWMWRSIIRGHLANRNTDGIARVLQEVRENGHEPRPDMIAHYVKALVLGGDVPAAVALIDAASDERSFHALLTGALHAAALRADRQMAQGWMGVLDARGVKPTLKMFNILIHMYATRGDIDAVLTIVQRMGENKYPADAYTYAGIVAAGPTRPRSSSAR